MKRDDKAYIIRRDHRIKLVDLLSDETIFSLANGTLGTRGHFAEGYGDDSFPITLINGIYNTYPYRYEENYQGFPQVGQAIVTLPDTSYMRILTDEGPIDLTHQKLIDMKRSLDMKRGYTTRIATYMTKKGHTFVITERKLVTANRLQIVMELTIASPDYKGSLQIDSYLRMPTVKYIKNIDPRLPNVRRNLILRSLDIENGAAFLKAQTTSSRQRINVSMIHDQEVNYRFEEDAVVGVIETMLEPNKPFRLTKYTLYTSSFLQRASERRIHKIVDFIQPFDQYIKEEASARLPFWRRSAVELSDKVLEQALHYNIYQLNLNAGRHNVTHIAAKGITGTGYEGHYFWDAEVYMLPYFILTNPHRARKILMYRYLTLDQSRYEARQLGIRHGAKIAWRTINGEEASPFFPAGAAQIHINSDVAHALINYYYATNDERFMNKFLMEVIVETARFLLEWGSFDDEGMFHLYNVTGPDEYKTLINDNYYTNRMAKMHFEFVLSYVKKHEEVLAPMLKRIAMDEDEFIQMQKAADNMTLLIDDKKQIIKQDDSFIYKNELPLESISPEELPLLLSKHPLDIYRMQISKQADAILAPVILGDKPSTVYKNTFDYYIKRTTHDSSLSRAVFGIAAYALGKHDFGFDYLKRVIDLDFRDSHNRTQHGLHIANLGGSYLMIIYGLFGLRFGQNLILNPVKQKELSHVKTRIIYQGVTIWLTLTHKSLIVQTNKAIDIAVMHKVETIKGKRIFHLQ